MTDGDYTIEDAFPVHSEEAFQRGIQYQARYIGSMDVQRPQSRAEIVAAMRRVRFEFKAKGTKKHKVVVAISLDGVSLIFKRPPKQRPPAPSHEGSIGCGQLLMHHPIYRIFYVSHDSQDLNIFSYIARDSHRNAFKCNVFKASKKTQAVRIVRTIGQAFEICHQLSLASKEQHQQQQQQQQHQQRKHHESSETGKAKEEPTSAPQHQDPQQQLLHLQHQEKQTASVSTATSPSWEELLLFVQPPKAGTAAPTLADLDGASCPLARHHSRQLNKQQLEHQAQQTHLALSQVRLLRDQLAAETTARIEAQARAQQLLTQNRDLLDHLNQLVHRTRALELSLHQQHRTEDPSAAAHTSFAENSGDSPDSGHKEMSSDSLSRSLSLSEACGFREVALMMLQTAAGPPQQLRDMSVLPVPPQRRSMQAPASLDCRPRTQRLHCGIGVAPELVGSGGGEARKAASQSSGDVSHVAVVPDGSAVPAATFAASTSTSARMPAAWSELFGQEDALSAAHLNHSFEWNGEASQNDDSRITAS